MILGTVDRHRTPVVPLFLRGAAGQEMGCEWRGHSSVTLANGAVEWCDVYRATVGWDGSRRSVLAESAETEPLIGTRLLNGCRLWMHVIRGGEVRIETSSEGTP